MNNGLPIPEPDGGWVVDRYSPDSRLGARPNSGAATDSGGLDFAALLRIISNWRWLILGAIALGLIGAVVVTLLTTPLYRSWVTLEVNPPTVEIIYR